MVQESDDKYAVIFDAIHDAVFIQDAKSGTILNVNDAMLEMYGYAREEVANLTIADVSSGEPPYNPASAQKLVTAARSGQPQLFEWEAKKKNGDTFWVEVSLSCTEVSSEQLIIAVVRDISTRKNAEMLHKETERLLEFTQFTVHQAQIAVFWCHSSGFFFYVNDTACEWLQYSREELMSMHVADINPDFPRTAWDDHWNDIRTHGLVQMQSFHRRKNGEIYPVEIYSNYVQFEGKEYKLGFVHDISTQKKTEQEKKVLEEQLRQAQKMEAIGTLAGGVAHDLNNMLSPILGYAELIKNTLPTVDQRWGQLNEIFKAGLRARNLTRQLLTFGRKQPLSIRPINLNSVISGFEKMLRRTIRENITIETDLADTLPAIDGDQGQIEQIILNLAVNAQDAMPDGGTLTIETREIFLDDKFTDFGTEDKTGPYILMAVSDTGQGIDKKLLPRIFEPFFTTKEKGSGTGLGLSTAYGITQQHGGYLWVYSELGQGSTFKVYLPQSKTKETVISAEEGLSEPMQGDETILVVEDNKQVLALAKYILEDCGYKVLEANSPTAAIALASDDERTIDLLLTDVVMPDLNGKELYDRLVDRLPGLKVLFMSGYTGNVIVHHGVIDKDINFISKPFGVSDLACKVREVLDR